MNIGFDAKRAFLNNSGLGNYSRNLILGMMELFLEHQYVLFTTEQKINFLQQYHPNVLIKQPSKIIDRIFPSYWRSNLITKEKDFRFLDVYHGLSAELPMNIHKFKGKKVVTIHDLIFELYPEYYSKIDRFIYRKKTKYACENADVIIAASNQTKSDLIQIYQVDEGKIHTVYQMYEEPAQNRNGIILNKKKENNQMGDKPYIVYISSFNPRKNHIRLLKAFKEAQLESEFQLVFIGQENSYVDKIKKEISALYLEQKVRLHLDLSDLQVSEVLKNSLAMVYLSEYEGFGIPILEGYAAGKSILASNTSSMKEIGQDACILVNPLDIDEIANGLKQLVVDSTEHEIRKLEGRKKMNELFSKKVFVKNTFQYYL